MASQIGRVEKSNPLEVPLQLFRLQKPGSTHLAGRATSENVSPHDVRRLRQKLDIHETSNLVRYASRCGLIQSLEVSASVSLTRFRSFHSNQIDDSPACLFSLAHYAAASNRGHSGP
jgi:hypothetical protein